MFGANPVGNPSVNYGSYKRNPVPGKETNDVEMKDVSPDTVQFFDYRPSSSNELPSRPSSTSHPSNNIPNFLTFDIKTLESLGAINPSAVRHNVASQSVDGTVMKKPTFGDDTSDGYSSGEELAGYSSGEDEELAGIFNSNLKINEEEDKEESAP